MTADDPIDSDPIDDAAMNDAAIELSRQDARRLAILGQRLDAASVASAAEAPDPIVDTVAALAGLPLDWTPTIAPGHDHLLFSRLGPDYDPDDLAVATEQRRALFELAGTLRPMADLPLWRPVMRDWPPYEGWTTWLDDNEPFRRDVLERLEAEGPLAATEIEDTSIRPWASTGWTNAKNVVRMLDALERRGAIAVAEREGVVRRYDLAARVYPSSGAAAATVDDETARQERARRRLASLGIARSRLAGSEFEPKATLTAGVAARVEGVRGEWRVDEHALERLAGFAGRTAVINPLDRLVFDRTRLLDLFETEYTLEMYKPKAQRRWGYFALPILHGDRIVGKLDATVERDAGRLRVDALHEDAPFDAATRRAVLGAIDELAGWLRVRVTGLG